MGARGSFKPKIRTPGDISAISSWFRVANATVTGSGISSLPDVLNNNPATQSTDASRPLLGTSANGLPIITVTNHFLTLPIIAANSNTSTWGIWFWIKPNGASNGPVYACRTTAGSSVNRFDVFLTTSLGTLVSEFFVGGVRTYTIPNTTAGWHFVTIEYDVSKTGDARVTITRDGVVVAITVGGAAVTPSLPAVTGDSTLFKVGAFVINAQIGPNFGFLGSRMSSAGPGLLTTAARSFLANFEAPT